FEIRFRPITRRALEIARQYNLNPVRCQPTTVSGLTTMRACFQPDQNLRAKTKKDFIERSQSRSWMLSFQDGELLGPKLGPFRPQSGVLGRQRQQTQQDFW